MSGSEHPPNPDNKDGPEGHPPVIPGHQLLRLIARGGYGEVWLARTELGTFRAVKILHRKNFTDAKPYDREFAGIQRYEPVSREHEGLMDVLQVGRDEAAGFFYYVMELADAAKPPGEDGRSKMEDGNNVQAGSRHPQSSILDPRTYVPLTLAHAIKQRKRLPVGKVIELGINLARALEFLHSRRLVHRDIKPPNIIFVNGQPKLADVGLIAALGGPLTFVGTAGYLPPEGPGTAQADIYSLGKVLYEAATGKDREEFPELPTDLMVEQASCLSLPDRLEAPSPPNDPALLELNEVLLKACESNPRARYATAASMAEDLERIKAGRSLVQRRTRRRQVRNIAFGTAAVTVAALLAAGLAAFIQYERSKPRLLFREDFNNQEIDTNLWTWNQRIWWTDAVEPSSESNVEQSGGEAVLNAKVGPSKDSAVRAVWLDFFPNLRTNGPCSIVVDLAGSVLNGAIGATICNGSGFTNSTGFDDTPLVRFESHGDTSEQQWSPRTLRLDILPQCQAAVAFNGTNRLDEFKVWDLASLPAWHLRFWVRATTSHGFEAGQAQLRVQGVRVTSRMNDKRVVGCVVDDRTEWPVKDAVIKDDSGKPLTKTRASGDFVVSTPFTGALTVGKTNYESASVAVKPYPQQRSVLNVRLLKTNFTLGDPMDFIRYGDLDISAIGFWKGSLWAFNYYPDGRGRLLRVDTSKMALDNTTPPIPQQTWLTSFVECDGRLIGLANWHGKDHNGVVLDLSTDPPRVLTLTDPVTGAPLRWPRGCAFVGQELWFAETDFPDRRYQLHRLDFSRWQLMEPLTTGARQIFGLTWDEKQLWASNGEGDVYPIDPSEAVKMKSVSYGSGPGFAGKYQCLTFGEGQLWGLEQDRRRICKIKITD